MADLRSVLNSSVPATTAGAALLGVLFHLAIRPFEIDSRAWTLIFSYYGALAALSASYLTVAGFDLSTALARTSLVGIAFIVGLVSSMIIYRGFLHRLRRIPGPFAARLSKLYHMLVAAKTLQNNLNVQKLHAKYGDFVRTGPREVSINRASAIKQIYGPPSGCMKGPWYSQVSDDVTKISLNSIRDFELHRRRRRAWDRGLGFKALSIYEPRVMSKVDLFLSRIGSGKPVNITEYSVFLSFDIMGEVGFSKDFHMLESGREHPAIQGLHESMVAIGIVGAMPWLLSALSKIPGATGGYDRFTRWCSQELETKKKLLSAKDQRYENNDPQDVMSWLIRAKDENDRSAPPTEMALSEDSRLLVITGSDTTSGAIASAIFLLTKHPDIYQKLRQSVEATLPGGERDWTYDKFKDISYLNWVIYETLRLHPSVPVGIPRLTPPEGLTIDEQYIPGDTIVSVPCYTIQRDERYWENPLEFIPERWERLSTENGAYIPFTRGQFGCPGKNLAFMELRMVLSKMVLRYDLSFAPGEDPKQFETGAKDTFTSSLPPLRLIFSARK